jgi:hypothetical protein
MQINIIYVAEKMSFQSNDEVCHLGRGTFAVIDGHVRFLCEEIDISLNEAYTLAQRKMEFGGVAIEGIATNG